MVAIRGSGQWPSLGGPVIACNGQGRDGNRAGKQQSLHHSEAVKLENKRPVERNRIAGELAGNNHVQEVVAPIAAQSSALGRVTSFVN
jgi:hypothetical protein